MRKRLMALALSGVAALATLIVPNQAAQAAARQADCPPSLLGHCSFEPTVQPECPPILMWRCSFDPAAYHNNTPSDPTDYGNYDKANRPADGTKIKGVTIHDIEGTCEDAVEAFKNPTYFVSSTYVICADGRIIQMVGLMNIPWTAGNWWFNSHHVQIEHAGHATSPTEYTNAMYLSSAILVRWLSQKFGFPLDRAHVHGHDNVPATTGLGIPRMHVDPGPFWNWQKYMMLLGAPVLPSGNPFTADMVTIAPLWPLNKQVVTGCTVSNEVPPPCVPAGGPFSTNFVYLRTAPSHSAPFITDPVTGPGSTEIENRSARAFYGQRFRLANSDNLDTSRQSDGHGVWYKIWFGGQGAWFYSPYAAPTALPASGQCVTPKGSAPVAVYGRPLPELSEWPANFTPPPGSQPAPTAFPYTIQPGQCYAVIETDVQADHYFSWSFDDTYPRFRVVGETRYVWIQFNGRQAFVKQADVALVA